MTSPHTCSGALRPRQRDFRFLLLSICFPEIATPVVSFLVKNLCLFWVKSLQSAAPPVYNPPSTGHGPRDGPPEVACLLGFFLEVQDARKPGKEFEDVQHTDGTD